jgi:thiol-disulfide isomerase/thioredoxin
MQKINTKDEFNTMIQSETPVVIKFFATWCPDCTKLNMFIDEIIEENPDKKWFEIDRDEFLDIAEEYQVMGIPSLLVFQNGEKIAHQHSANTKTPEEVKEFLRLI